MTAGGSSSLEAATGTTSTSTVSSTTTTAAAQPNKQRGAFIVLEGVDRCGKTTQVARLVESLRAQVLFRFIDYANALWSDIGTPTLTGSQTSPFAGTYATSAVQFDDNDGAAYEGRAQTVTVSAGVAHTMQHRPKSAALSLTARLASWKAAG